MLGGISCAPRVVDAEPDREADDHEAGNGQDVDQGLHMGLSYRLRCDLITIGSTGILLSTGLGLGVGHNNNGTDIIPAR